MSISTELSRIQAARNKLRTKGVSLGITNGTDKLDVIADAFDGIVDRGAVSAQVREGETYSIPKGYHNGSGTVSGVSGGGSYTLQSKTATPTKSQQNITPDSGYYGLSDVTVQPIPDQYQDVQNVTAGAADVLANKIIVTSDGTETAGTMPNNGAVSKTLEIGDETYTVPKGYHSGSGSVKIVPESKSVTPNKSTQNVTPASGKVLSAVTVAPIPDAYIVTDDANATEDTILDGSSAYVKGRKVNGAMSNNGAVSLEIDGLNVTSVNIAKGYHNGGGTVTLTDDIETALATV